jgi:hypothetical protein
MTRSPARKIALVLNDGLGEALRANSQFDAFWISETPANLALEHELRQLAAPPSVTWFAQHDSEDDAVGELVTLIEDHHGPYVSSIAWEELTLFGAHDTSVLQRVLANDPDFLVDGSRLHVKRIKPA